MSAESSLDPARLEKVINLAKRRGFVFPSAEIYGGFRSTYDYGPLGVRVNCVSPGWVRTPMADQSMTAIGQMMGTDREGAYRIATKNVPIRRPGTSEEIANIILFLASEDSAVITGAVIMADGGYR